MPIDFTDLDLDTVHVDEDVLVKKHEYDKIFFNCYHTATGKRMFDTLRSRFVEVAIYKNGDSIEDVAYRQGMCDLILMMEACVEDALSHGQ